ncbi:hypothetical protein PAPYR_1827 [Paratrimastix pyriformis]|uniref:Uncharacterized protein n=1 Tax=Paratrimastix pyriformis TaxID=342808 RepID=A0ABQ8URE6_9EUKA|nr:hypothetical protein PAPYR_1827 [Paratrimastix pyriformis]
MANVPSADLSSKGLPTLAVSSLMNVSQIPLVYECFASRVQLFLQTIVHTIAYNRLVKVDDFLPTQNALYVPFYYCPKLEQQVSSEITKFCQETKPEKRLLVQFNLGSDTVEQWEIQIREPTMQSVGNDATRLHSAVLDVVQRANAAIASAPVGTPSAHSFPWSAVGELKCVVVKTPKSLITQFFSNFWH